MRKNILLCLLVIANLLINNKSYSQVPHLSGNMNISIKKGTISCDFILSNIPAINDYTVLLNSGFNIKYVRDSANRNNYYFLRSYDDQSAAESFQYIFFGAHDTAKVLPSSIRINYTGAFPVINDTTTMYDRLDWKGNMAFNGQSARATEQSAWYPVLYDKKTGIAIDKYTYKMDVHCEDCSSVYINGDEPKAGMSNTLSSDIPVPLLLYAGNYSFQKTNGQYFLNTGLSPEERDVLSNWTNSITGFYEKKLQVPYGRKISFISAGSVAKNRAWMFVTYPSLVSIENRNFSIHKLLLPTKPVTVDTGNIAYIAHELGHYYYGTLTSPNSDLRWFFLEGITEFLSLQYVQENLGEAVYRNAIKGYLQEIKAMKKIVPLSSFKNSDDIDYLYRYKYIPLLLTALKKQVGAAQTWKWLSLLAKEKQATTDYAYFKNSLSRAGVSAVDIATFEKKFITDPSARENLVGSLESGGGVVLSLGKDGKFE